MGLDQYAYVKSKTVPSGEEEPAFIWRKHSKLQEWAETLFNAKTGKPAPDLNCAELQLDPDDIDGLAKLLEDSALPASPGGFFYGHQFQDEQAEYYAAQDQAFCVWARDAIAQGETVIYSCWW